MKLLLDENLSRRLVPALDWATHHGPPPVVMRLALGNCSNAQVLDALLQQQQHVEQALLDPAVRLVQVS